jgi:hypothetical protein
MTLLHIAEVPVASPMPLRSSAKKLRPTRWRQPGWQSSVTSAKSGARSGCRPADGSWRAPPRFSQEDQKDRRFDCSPRLSARNAAADRLRQRDPPSLAFCPSDLPVKDASAIRAANWQPPGALRSEDTDVRQIAVLLGVVQAVADHEHIGDREAQVVDFDGAHAARWLVQQRAHFHARRHTRQKLFS